MRLLLVNPPITAFYYDVAPLLPPLGIMYIASMARNSGHEVSIFDFVAKGANPLPAVIRKNNTTEPYLRYGISDDVFLSHLERFRPHLVGLSNIMAVTESECLRLARLIKQHTPGTAIILGGTNSTARASTILKNSYIDFVYRGEADAAFIGFLNLFNSPNRYSSVPGICYRQNGDIKISEEIPVLDNLGKNPLPAWDIIGIEAYLKPDFPFSFHLSRRTTTMITSRGCIRNCIFCSGKKLLGSWRARSAEDIIAEALILKEKYNIEEIQFLDSNISLDKQRFERFLQLWKDKVKLSWAPVGGLDVSTIDSQIIRKMGESGCHSFPLGIEAGSRRLQGRIGKIVPKENVARICSSARKQGIWTHGLFIIGFPEETEEDVHAIFDYSKETDLDSISLFALSPLPGSQLYSQFIDDDYFDPDLSRIAGAHFHLAAMPHGLMIKLRKELAHRFFWWKLFRELRPGSIIVRLRSPQFWNMARFITKSIKRFLLLKTRDRIKGVNIKKLEIR